MDVTIPTAPLGVLTLLAFFGTYAVSFLNGVLPFVHKPWQKRAVSVAVAIVLAAVVIVFYHQLTGEPIGNPWLFALLSIVIVSASYALVTKDLGAKRLEHFADSDSSVS
ncbi:hypothetical protein [Microbacterium sp. AG238]|uniref:hypothetical protein n=1 Tax=Microbacterium sp. AG238 TaxID=2183994 RepID=UPI000E7670AD|nr:hypothetical protein [Microbacterium sp. AG238]RKE60475.1 hypothetical protein DEU36_2917 [Microbacterium sp. AG238]